MENGAKKSAKKDRRTSDLPGCHKGGLSATRATLLGGYRRDEDGENGWPSRMDERMDERELEKELVERERI